MAASQPVFRNGSRPGSRTPPSVGSWLPNGVLAAFAPIAGPEQGSDAEASAGLRLLVAERQFREAQDQNLERFLAEQRQVFISLGIPLRGTDLAPPPAPTTSATPSEPLPENTTIGLDLPLLAAQRPRRETRRISISSPPKGKHSDGELSRFTSTDESDSDDSSNARSMWTSLSFFQLGPFPNLRDTTLSRVQARTGIDPKNWLQRKLLPITQHHIFDVFSGALVLAMCLLLALDVHLKVVHIFAEGPGSSVPEPPRWEDDLNYWGQRITLYMFSAEMILRLLAEQQDFFLGPRRRWNLFDTAILILNLIKYVPRCHVTGLSITRLGRLIRMIQLLEASKDLRTMLYSFVACGQSLAWSMCLFFLIIYIFAIFFLEVALIYLKYLSESTAPREQDMFMTLSQYWDGMPHAMRSLIFSITGGVDWGEIAEPFFTMNGVFGIMFIGFVFMMTLGLLNVLVGVFVQKADQLGDWNRDVALGNAAAKHDASEKCLGELFQELDISNTGKLSLEDITAGLNAPRIRAYFQHLQIDFTDPHLMWEIMDKDGNGQVDISEFIDSCTRLRGAAKPAEVAEIRLLSRKMCSMLESLASSRPGVN